MNNDRFDRFIERMKAQKMAHKHWQILRNPHNILHCINIKLEKVMIISTLFLSIISNNGISFECKDNILYFWSLYVFIWFPTNWSIIQKMNTIKISWNDSSRNKDEKVKALFKRISISNQAINALFYDQFIHSSME